MNMLLLGDLRVGDMFIATSERMGEQRCLVHRVDREKIKPGPQGKNAVLVYLRAMCVDEDGLLYDWSISGWADSVLLPGCTVVHLPKRRGR